MTTMSLLDAARTRLADARNEALSAHTRYDAAVSTIELAARAHAGPRASFDWLATAGLISRALARKLEQWPHDRYSVVVSSGDADGLAATASALLGQ